MGPRLNILLIGQGGREHALAAALARSERTRDLLVAPGNPGTAQHGRNVVLDVADHRAVVDFCRVMGVGLVVVGPETPLVAGIVDDLAAAGVPAFGPGRAAARLEGSKAFTKEICAEAGVPTARCAIAADRETARRVLSDWGAPIVVKYDGLMGGKGVTVAATLAEAEAAVESLYSGEPDATVVFEERLVGTEASLFCLVDGETAIPFGSAQDHKRAFDGDRGPNTGGMGAVSPAPALTAALQDQALAEIVRPTIRALAARGTPYRGVLFAGLMLTAAGPKLIEYNCRFGDPECQTLTLRLESDLVALMLATIEGRLAGETPRWRDEAAVAVVMAAQGYPRAFERGELIQGVEEAGRLPGVTIFQAGTRVDGERLLSDGGRVLNVCATGASVDQARARAYAAADAIRLAGRVLPPRHRADRRRCR